MLYFLWFWLDSVRQRRRLWADLDCFVPFDSKACCIEAAQGLVQAGEGALARMIGEQDGDILVFAKDVFRQCLEHALGAHLNEYAHAFVVESFDALDKLHGRGDLAAQDLDDLAAVGGISLAGHVGDDRQAGRAHVHAADDLLERHAGRCDDARVEGMRDRDLDGAVIGGLECSNGSVHSRGLAANDRLVVAVDVGQGDVSLDAGQDALYLGQRRENGGHVAVVFHRDLAHLAASCADHVQCVGKGEHTRSDQGGVFAKAVPDDHIGDEAIACQEPGQGHVNGQHRGLGDRRIAQLGFGGIETLLVLGVRKEIAGQRAPEQGGHDLVGLAKSLGDDRVEVAQLAQHVDVLRALAWKQKGHLTGLAAPAKDALGGQGVPHGRDIGFERAHCLFTALDQFLRVAKVNGQPFLCLQVRSGWSMARGHAACAGIREGHLEAGLQAERIGCAEHQHVTRGCLGFGFALPAVAVAPGDARPRERTALGSEHARNMLLEDHVKVGAAEPKRTHPCAPHAVIGALPLPQLDVHIEGQSVKVNAGVGLVKVGRGGQHFIAQGVDHLEQTRRTGRALEVAQVGFDRAEGDASPGQTELAEHAAHALHLDHVPDGGGRAVSLDVRRRGWGEAGVLPCALDGPLLTDRVGGGDPFASAIAGTADAADDGIDPVSVALGVVQALEHQDHGSLAHHKAVGPLCVGPGAVGAEGADLAELDKGGRAHVAVDAPGERGVKLPGDQSLDRGMEGRHGGSAGGVGDKVGAAQVERVGHAAGDDVGQLAGHGILGDAGDAVADLFAHAAQDRQLQVRRELLKVGHGFEGVDVLGQVNAQGGDVVVLPGHGIAQDDGRVLRIHGAIRIAIVEQGRAGSGDGPFLRAVHGIQHLGRHRHAPLEGVELVFAHPTADLGVGLVGRLGIGMVVVLWIPAIRRDLCDAVSPLLYVLPECGRVGRIWENCTHADDGYRSVCLVRHRYSLLQTFLRSGKEMRVTAKAELDLPARISKGLGNQIHVRQEPVLSAKNGRQGQCRAQLVHTGRVLRTGDPAHSFRRDVQGCLASIDAAHGLDRRPLQARHLLRPIGGVAGHRCRALGEGDPFAQPEQDVLVAGEAAHAGDLEQDVQSTESQGGQVRADIWRARLEGIDGGRHLGIVLASRLQVIAPPVTGDGPLHDLGCSLIDGGDAQVAADALDGVFSGVSIAAQGLNGRVGGGIARLSGDQLGDRTLGAQVAFSGVDATRHLFDVGAGDLEAHGVGHEQFVGECLLVDERRAGLHALLGIADGALQGGHPPAQAKRGDHQPRKAEHLLGLDHSLPFHPADQVLDGDEHVLQGEGSGVRDADAVLVLCLAGRKALCALFDDEEGESAGRFGEDGVQVGDAAVGDELLVAVEPVANDPAILRDRVCPGADHGQVASGSGFGDPVGDEHALLGDLAHPQGLLLGRSPNDDRVQAEERGQHRAAQPQVDARDGFRHAVDVVRAAAHPPVFLGDEEQVNAELRAVHLTQDILGTFILVVQFAQHVAGKALGGKVLDRGQDHLQCFCVQASRHKRNLPM